MGKDGERSSQGTCLKDPWYWTTGLGLTEGMEGGQGRESHVGKTGTTVIEQ